MLAIRGQIAQAQIEIRETCGLLAQDGDEQAATLALRTAREIFRKVPAEGLVDRCEALAQTLGSA